MSLTDNELKDLEEQCTTTLSSVGYDQSYLSSSVPSPSSSSSPLLSYPSSPLVHSPSPVRSLLPAPSRLQITSLPQDASPLPSAIPKPHAEPQSQYSTSGNPQQVSFAPNAAAQTTQDSYIDPSDKFWSLYLSEADKEDAHLVESWKGDTEGILIFTGLFAATVATFVNQTYQLLTPSSDDTSVAILLQVSQQIAGLSNGTSVPAYTTSPFNAPFYAVWVNTLWFLSLFLSLTGALMATLMQQWTRRYLRGIRYRSAPHIRGPMHVALRLGVKKYKMKQAVALITSILHASVFIFFAGLVGFAFSLNSTVASVLTTCVSLLLAAYIFLSILPMLSTVAPYDTVLTPALQASLRLGSILFALVRRRVQEVRAFPWHLIQRSELPHNLEMSTEENREHRSRSREQELMHIVRQKDYLNIPRATYVLDRVLMNADEHHEVETFLDSMAILLRGQSDSPLVYGQNLEIPFKRHFLSDKLQSLLNSCGHLNSNMTSLSIRIKRLHIVLAFVRHESIREVAHLNEEMVQWHSNYRYTLRRLARDIDPSISFLSRLTRICASMETNVDGKIRCYDLTDALTATTAYGWYGEGTDTVAWPLFCFVELVCTILKYATSNGVSDPVAAYHGLWTSILLDAQRYATGYLDKNLRESEDLITEPIPRALLTAVGLGDLVHPFYSPPARRLPTDEEQIQISRALSTYPSLLNALREVAEIASLTPLYGPSPQPNHEYEAPSVRPSDSSKSERAFTSSLRTTDAAWILFGPLTWDSEPADSYLRLMYAWSEDFVAYFSIVDDACEVVEDHPRGKGYAKICFRYKADAQKFVDAWKANPLPAYRNVTAEILDNIDSSTDRNGKSNAAHAGEESAAQGRGQADDSWRRSQGLPEAPRLVFASVIPM